jgi:hypothetical protein
MSKKKAFHLPFTGNENDSLGREFLDAPEKFAKKFGLKLEDLSCPPEAHQALDRGKKFSEEIEGLGKISNAQLIKKGKEIAGRRFGKDYEVALIPFGLKFREKIEIEPSCNWTATATGKITFLDTGADVDG